MIENSVTFMEDNLHSDLNRQDIARAIGMSIYHFHRIFKSAVGESTREYLSKRRLTEAAHRLLYSNEKILDIALQYNYGSQEAFSRAFKSRFDVTPGEYREFGRHLTIERPRLTPEILLHLQKGLTLEPKIVEKQEIRVVGIRNFCIVPPSDNQLFNTWDCFVPRIREIGNKKEPLVFAGIHEFLPDINRYCDTEYSYMAGVFADRLSPLPSGMVSMTIPAARYVVFTHRPKVLSRLEADRYIYGTWFPNSDHKQAGLNIIVELRRSLEDPEYDICIPIE